MCLLKNVVLYLLVLIIKNGVLLICVDMLKFCIILLIKKLGFILVYFNNYVSIFVVVVLLCVLVIVNIYEFCNRLCFNYLGFEV